LFSESQSSLFISKPWQSTSLDLIITITPDFVWSMSIGSTQLCKDQCHLLKNFPPKLNNVTVVLKMLSCLDNSTLCKGNPDKKFEEILQRYFISSNCHKPLYCLSLVRCI
jgi:hypothetical protein